MYLCARQHCKIAELCLEIHEFSPCLQEKIQIVLGSVKKRAPIPTRHRMQWRKARQWEKQIVRKKNQHSISILQWCNSWHNLAACNLRSHGEFEDTEREKDGATKTRRYSIEANTMKHFQCKEIRDNVTITTTRKWNFMQEEKKGKQQNAAALMIPMRNKRIGKLA